MIAAITNEYSSGKQGHRDDAADGAKRRQEQAFEGSRDQLLTDYFGDREARVQDAHQRDADNHESEVAF